MMPIGEHNQVEIIIQQARELINNSGNMAEELSEDQMDLVVAGVSAPEYQQFIQNIWKKRRGENGPETNR